MIKCKFCGSATIERYISPLPMDDLGGEFGDYEHICNNCGAIGSEVFGHGISWAKENLTNQVSNKGWICPKCDRVINPNIKYCNCK